MFDRIVVGYDQSEGSKDALGLAADLAEGTEAGITVVTSVPTPVGGSFAPSLPADAYTALREQAQTAAEVAAAPLGAGALVVEATSPAFGIGQAVDQVGADLVVLGTGRADPGRVHAGHKAHHLMQEGTAAVLLAPVGYAEGGTLDRVGVAVNGTPESERAVAAAADLAGGGALRVISVATDFAEYWGHWTATIAISELTEASRETAQNALDEAVASLPEGVTADPVLLEGDSVVELGNESSRGLDLLCLGSRSYGPVRRVLLGSTSSGVVADAGCAVLVVPRGDS